MFSIQSNTDWEQQALKLPTKPTEKQTKHTKEKKFKTHVKRQNYNLFKLPVGTEIDIECCIPNCYTRSVL